MGAFASPILGHIEYVTADVDTFEGLTVPSSKFHLWCDSVWVSEDSPDSNVGSEWWRLADLRLRMMRLTLWFRLWSM